MPELRGRHLATGSDGTLRVAALEGDQLREWSGPEALAQLRALRERPNVALWVDYTGPSPAQVAEVGAMLELHPLIVEDIAEGNQRSKIETTDGLVHIVLFALEFDEDVVASEIDVVLGLGFLFTVHEADWDPRQTSHLRAGLAPILRKGPDHLLWALADSIVDGYFPFADRLGDAIDAVQDDVIERASPEVLERLFRLKRELLAVRRAAAPVREIFSQLTNRDLALIDHEEIIYFRDIYDHVIRLTDELDNYRELASATLDVYLSTVNNNLSLIMKRLTGVTVIVAGIGAVAGIFGMSEAGSALAGQEAGGFWIVTTATVAAAAVVALVLRRIDWV
ncbi:MAG TPA: CorA family divalent cation transporter [Candidatus Limnocylindrales bacterium]|nr:CorA family divalent cation transporter [Candidatus Limnocylindrales bacterium]